jgi:tetratricopeptide (TPR) repeat protein
MNILYEVLESFTKEELRHFKMFSERINDDKQRKDLMLLAYMRRSGKNYSDDFISRKLYGTEGNPAFYRLKNRLTENLCDFLTLHHLWKSDLNELNRYLSLYNIFLHKNLYQLASLHLKKAEKKATEVEHFEMLDMIYSNFVKLSNELITVNPESYIQKRKENAEKLNKIREADQALAALTYRLKLTQNVAGRKDAAITNLNNTINEFTTNPALRKSKSFQTRAYQAVSQILLQQHNYPALESFLKETLQKFKSEKWFDKENHETKLQMYTYTINSLFKNGKFHESLEYASQLGKEITAFNNLLYDKYLFFYYNSLVINYSSIDRKKALQTLEKFELEIKGKRNSYYDQFLYLNKAILLHQLGKPAEAIRNIVRLYVNDNFNKADDSIKLKIFMAELIMQFDAGDSDTYFTRSTTFKSQFSMLLKGKDFVREKQLVLLLDQMMKTQYFKKDAKLRIKAKAFIDGRAPETAQDSEIVGYSNWMAATWGVV